MREKERERERECVCTRESQREYVNFFLCCLGGGGGGGKGGLLFAFEVHLSLSLEGSLSKLTRNVLQVGVCVIAVLHSSLVRYCG